MDRNNRSTNNRASSSSVVAIMGRSPDDDLDMSLVKMLIILSRAGESGLTTRELLKRFQSTGYGQAILKEAVHKGYIERAPTKRTEHKGRGGIHVTMNYITPAGKQHLKGLLDD